MNKAEIVAILADALDRPRAEALTAVNLLLGRVAAALLQGQPVVLDDVCRLTLHRRPAMRGRHPHTGVPIDVAEGYRIRATVARDLRRRADELRQHRERFKS